MNEIKFTPTYEDLRAANLLVLRSAFPGCVRLYSYLAAAIIFLHVVAHGTIYWNFVLATAAGLIGLLSLIYSVNRYYSIPANAKQTIRLDRGLMTEVTVYWTPESYHSVNGQGTVDLRLRDAACWLADDQTLVVFRSRLFMYFLPRRAFTSQDQFEDLQRNLASAGVQRGWPPK